MILPINPDDICTSMSHDKQNATNKRSTWSKETARKKISPDPTYGSATDNGQVDTPKFVLGSPELESEPLSELSVGGLLVSGAAWKGGEVSYALRVVVRCSLAVSTT